MSRFRDACVQGGSTLEHACLRGLDALKAAHRHCVFPRQPRRITGSIDLDGALERAHPHANRWDYGIGYRHPGGVERVHWMEVHPATVKEVGAIRSKLRWLKLFLASEARDLQAMTRSGKGGAIVWVHTGSSRIRGATRARRMLAQAGIRGPLRRLELS